MKIQIRIAATNERERAILKMLMISIPDELFDRGANSWELATDSKRAALILKSINTLLEMEF